MKTHCEDQTNTNNTLDIAHPALDDAYQILKEEHLDAKASYIEKLFEETYKCKVNFDSSFGGSVTFNTNKDLVWFLLKHDSTGNNG
jgi:hypothetical protein